MSCRPLDVESFRNRARLLKGITRRKRAGYDESKELAGRYCLPVALSAIQRAYGLETIIRSFEERSAAMSSRTLEAIVAHTAIAVIKLHQPVPDGHCWCFVHYILVGANA